MNSAYRSLFVSRVAAAIGDATAAADVSHAGVKGTIREILIRELFRPLLPSGVGIGTGHIVTKSDEKSPEQDVIIYDRRVLPPILFEHTVGLFPVESVIATIEVKSVLNATELRSAYESARVVHAYSYLSGRREQDTEGTGRHTVQKLISTILALDTDLVIGGKTELERYLELHSYGDTPVRAICVAGRGYWFFSDQHEWCFVSPDEEHSEILIFIAGLLDKLIEVGLSRSHPSLVPYLIGDLRVERGLA